MIVLLIIWRTKVTDRLTNMLFKKTNICQGKWSSSSLKFKTLELTSYKIELKTCNLQQGKLKSIFSSKSLSLQRHSFTFYRKKGNIKNLDSRLLCVYLESSNNLVLYHIFEVVSITQCIKYIKNILSFLTTWLKKFTRTYWKTEMSGIWTLTFLYGLLFLIYNI